MSPDPKAVGCRGWLAQAGSSESRTIHTGIRLSHPGHWIMNAPMIYQWPSMLILTDMRMSGGNTKMSLTTDVRDSHWLPRNPLTRTQKGVWYLTALKWLHPKSPGESALLSKWNSLPTNNLHFYSIIILFEPFSQKLLLEGLYMTGSVSGAYTQKPALNLLPLLR